uniref:BHLH domain-containing protein n=1 Tax=Pogona vitticeps TaxID=103695 RepID=A0ABM5EY73_9SAUR
MARSSFFPGPLAGAALPPPSSCWVGPPLLPEASEASWGRVLGQSPGSHSGSSPASSPDSCGGGGGFSPSGCPWRPGLGRRKGGRPRLGHGQRQSASQREKLRMRHLAQALHALRRYLPASVAPAGQNLTKIETLRLAIRYIAHLSELLGLSEEELARRGAARARPGCPLCPAGLGCCQAESGPLPDPQAWPSELQLAPPTAATAFPPPGSPRGAAQPPSCSASSEPPLGSPVPAAAAAAAASHPWARWALLPGGPSCTATGMPGQAPSAWATAGTRAEMRPPEEEEEWPAPRELPAHHQSLPEELLSFLEGFVPLALQDCLSPAHPLPALLTSGLEARKEGP